MVDEDENELDDDDEGLIDEHEDLTRVLNYYEEKYGESVGIMPAVVDTKEIEMDLIIGINSDKVLGIRMFQFFPVDEDEEAEESDEEASEVKPGDEDEDVEEEAFDVYITDLTKAGNERVEGKVMFTAEVPAPVPYDENGEDEEGKEDTKEAKEETGEKEEKYWINVSVYYVDSEDGIPEFTGAVLFYIDDPDTKITFLHNEELEG
ncbi:MAG TPA: hypothetical protein VKM55_13930 [Candidatus Lokiarchaeia archaeon]|nr:hypothetical protein [Candidatus Lokiarchaeia archaeon]